MADKIQHSLIDGISNYIRMNNSGALMITGNWGCGKTFFVKNTVIPSIKDSLNKNIIMVSLFGITDLSEIPERILYAYWDEFGKENAGLDLGKVAKVVSKLTDSIPKLKEYVDINKLVGKGQGIYKLIPNDIIICLDDLERVVETIDINNVLGVINELVENLGYKVIVIANEGFIKGERLIFKEKVVEKTLVFIPDTIKVFSAIVKSYGNEIFENYMCSEAVKLISHDNPLFLRSGLYRKQVSNIRILKFAIEHFYSLFCYYHAKFEINDPTTQTKLRNYWSFILATSIEYKLNNISYEDDRTLSKYIYNPIPNFDIDLGVSDEDIRFENSIDDVSEEEKELKEKSDTSFQEIFYKKYFTLQEEHPIFHQELYSYITGAITPDYDKLDADMENSLKQFVKAGNPAHELLNKFMKGIWGFNNEEFSAKLEELLAYVKTGKLEDFVSYLNASFFLLNYKELFHKTDEEITLDIKSGIDTFMNKTEISYIGKTNLQMVYTSLPAIVKGMYDYIMQCISEKEHEKNQELVENMNKLFSDDLKALVDELVVLPYGPTPKYLDIPVLSYLRKDVVMKKMNESQPYDIYLLISLLESRFERIVLDVKREELKFVEMLSSIIDKMALDNTVLSNMLIKQYLWPKVNAILGL